MEQSVDETKGSYWTRGGFVHRARVFCPSCGSRGWVSGSLCAACEGSGFIMVGCGGEAEKDPYWSDRGLGANCMQCNHIVPTQHVSTLEEAQKLQAVTQSRQWVQVSERDV